MNIYDSMHKESEYVIWNEWHNVILFFIISPSALFIVGSASSVSCLSLDVYGWCPCCSVLGGARVNAVLYLCWPPGAIKSHNFFISWVWPDFLDGLLKQYGEKNLMVRKCRYIRVIVYFIFLFALQRKKMLYKFTSVIWLIMDFDFIQYIVFF